MRRPLFVSASRFPLLAVGLLAGLIALWSGLGRLGWSFAGNSLMALHGPLMVGGFLGTVIGVERAVALRSTWAYLGPLGTALGALALLVGLPGSPLMLAGSLGLAVTFMVIVRRQPDLSTVTMATGAVLWIVGNSGWVLGWAVPYVVPWWSGFLLLTIAGERLELSRVLRLSAAQRGAFVLAEGVILAGLIMSLAAFDRGMRLYGAGMMALAWWLLRYDIAGRTVWQTGVTRYIAVCLLSAYGWLGLAGALTWYLGGLLAGFYYDAMLHAVFVGFVLAMLFGHAPIIFPAVLGRPVSYHPWLYLPLVGLHLSLGLRLAGDLAAWLPGRLWGGLLNAVVMLLFFVMLGGTLLRAERQGNPVSSGEPSAHR
jgi:hypothetical protein